MIILDITLPGLPDSPNKSRYANRYTVSRDVRKWQAKVIAAVKDFKPPQPLERAKLTFTRHSSRPPDPDNLVSSFKALADGLKRGGIIKDDNFKVIGMPTYLWEQAPMGQGHVRIVVETISEVEIKRNPKEQTNDAK